MKRLVCVVEGKGEVEAIPNLCARILQHVGAHGWVVDPTPVRQPRGRLVDEKARSPLRGCHTDGVRKAVELACRRPGHAVLVLCDADDDCPATWAGDAATVIQARVAGSAVMALREYETWLLLNRSDEELAKVKVPVPERVRGAKEKLARIIPGYLPTTHQLAETRRLDIPRLRARSKSFDKLVRSLAALCGGFPADDAPPR